MKGLRDAIPSMFHRRLLLLLAGMAVASVLLAGQLVNLTVVQGAQKRADAERVLSSRKLVPTLRGRIYDRKGLVLAEDLPCFDIAVDYAVITGKWAYDKARADAYRDFRSTWGKMSFEEREATIAGYRAPYDATIERLWSMMVDLGGLSTEELERRKGVIVRRVQAVRADVWRRQVDQREREVGGPVELSEVATPIAEERESHTLLHAVPDDVAYEFRKLADELPDIAVEAARARTYRYLKFAIDLKRDTLPSPLRSEDELSVIEVDNVGGHFLGAMREVWAEDVERRPFHRRGETPDLGGYLPGDMTGHGGVEQAMEDRLRGLRGQVVTRRDTGLEARQPPERGRDVRISIDIMLQARIRAMMDPSFGLMRVQSWHGTDEAPVGTSLNGAVVVMEVDTGELVAMVSTPAPPARVPGEPYPDLTRDPDQPLFNRAISAVYPPGSTLKPLIYCMAATTGGVGWDQHIDCQGHLLESSPNHYRCWGWRPAEGKFLKHGPLGPAEAIARSCNIYFYACGRQMGAYTSVEQMHRWGFGRSTNLGLAEEVDGLLPSLTGSNREGRGLTLPNAIQMGIGQGPIAVPPVQVAAAHAALARGGYYLSPVLIRDRAEEQIERDLAIPPRVVANALEGMRASANESYGTGHHLSLSTGRENILNLDGVVVRAKTGTAQAPIQFEDFNENGEHDPGEPILRSGSHSWYVCHVQKPGEDRAAFVIVVMVEYGGSGGRVSGPVANQVLHALRAEGYL